MARLEEGREFAYHRSKTSTTRAAAESTIPALCAVYPIRVCRSCGMSTVELNKAIPRIRNIRFVVTTLKFLNNAHQRWALSETIPK